jgi:hypothetical protein
MPQDGAGFWFVTKAHASAHIEICAAEATPVTGQKTSKLWNCFFPPPLKNLDSQRAMTADYCIIKNSNLNTSKKFHDAQHGQVESQLQEVVLCSPFKSACS